MTWYYNDNIFNENEIDGYFGFVYLITNLVDGKRYIGKKLFTKAKRQTIKKKVKKSRVESDWRNYYGSNKKLQEDVKLLGESNFKRTILRLCKTRGDCSYWELHYQIVFGALAETGWYNDQIYVRIHRSHLSIDTKSKLNVPLTSTH